MSYGRAASRTIVAAPGLKAVGMFKLASFGPRGAMCDVPIGCAWIGEPQGRLGYDASV
jgi:hypothetical protein